MPAWKPFVCVLPRWRFGHEFAGCRATFFFAGLFIRLYATAYFINSSVEAVVAGFAVYRFVMKCFHLSILETALASAQAQRLDAPEPCLRIHIFWGMSPCARLINGCNEQRKRLPRVLASALHVTALQTVLPSFDGRCDDAEPAGTQP